MQGCLRLFFAALVELCLPREENVLLSAVSDSTKTAAAFLHRGRLFVFGVFFNLCRELVAGFSELRERGHKKGAGNREVSSPFVSLDHFPRDNVPHNPRFRLLANVGLVAPDLFC